MAVLWSILFLELSNHLAVSHYLYFSHPGDRTRKAGVYGGSLHYPSGEAHYDLFRYSYNCSTFDEKVQQDIPVTSFSYDVQLAEMLITSVTADNRRLSLYLGDACKSNNGGTCQAHGQSPLRTLMYEASFREKLRPFALYNSQIFFLMTTDSQVNDE